MFRPITRRILWTDTIASKRIPKKPATSASGRAATMGCNRAIPPRPPAKILKNMFTVVVRYNNKLQALCPTRQISAGCGPGARIRQSLASEYAAVSPFYQAALVTLIRKRSISFRLKRDLEVSKVDRTRLFSTNTKKTELRSAPTWCNETLLFPPEISLRLKTLVSSWQSSKFLQNCLDSKRLTNARSQAERFGERLMRPWISYHDHWKRLQRTQKGVSYLVFASDIPRISSILNICCSFIWRFCHKLLRLSAFFCKRSQYC